MKFKHLIVLSILIAQAKFAEAKLDRYIPLNRIFVSIEDTTKAAPENWFNLDPKDNKVRGVGTEKAYQSFLKKKQSKTVIVAVIDSGIDVKHEDLQGKIWINKGEVAGNGKDDDKNGYIDDVFGWNFIGGKDGKNVGGESYELTREYSKYKKKFEGVEESKVTEKDKKDYQYYKKVKEQFEKKSLESKQQFEQFKVIKGMFEQSSKVLKEYLKTDKLSPEAVKSMNTTNEEIKEAQNFMLNMYGYGINDAVLKDYMEQLENDVNFGYNTDFDSRKEIVGDNYSNLSEKFYGNNDVIGPDSKHGTHVAGIIGANRGNTLGMKGIADNVQIMVIRAVPNGDERDKDIANAIYYAVNNGAKIINMSFGKSFSPEKDVVDAAVKYAESKGVLLIHAAGNDAKDIDVENNFPNKKYLNSDKSAANWLEIGASSWGDNTNFVANFSNFGQKNVDVFAPGVDIYSTTPGQQYENLSGTSMAAPVVSGIAALLMSYYPNLTAVQVKDILIKSAIKYGSEKVNKPGSSEEMTEFDKLSATGSIVSAYEAVKMAEAMKK